MKKSKKVVNVQVSLTDFFPRMAQSQSYFTVQFPQGGTLVELLTLISGRYGSHFQKTLVEITASLQSEIVVILNHQIVSPDKLDDIQIERDSKIKILPLASGG